jgi:2-polyprenyl-6-methoxyphenol hydroxylase-like FAD-dependent oxidoreductase
MRIAIVGAGPVGLVLAGSLARRGHRIDLVDRDPGPRDDGAWPRKGVMQFHHAHALRRQVADVLSAELPEVYERWLGMGAEPIILRGPDAQETLVGVRSRRETLERAIRTVVENEPGVRFHTGHVRGIASRSGRACGIDLAQDVLTADLVLDASGRSSRVTDALPPPPGFGASCAIAYVDRQYQLRAGAGPGPLLNPVAWQAEYDGYQVIVFPHERGIFSVLFVRNTAHREFVPLRHDAVFDAVARTVPGLREWTDPERAQPISSVLTGGTLRNHYRSQRGVDGRLRLPGLISVGDAVCTTTPNFGRGLALSMLQVQELLRLVEDRGEDPGAVGEAFADWCDVKMRPWVEDHMAMDDALARRWLGEDLDLSKPLPSDRILVASEIDPTISRVAAPYLAMTAGPDVMRGLEPRARAVYETGWRPRLADGPTRADIVETIRRVAA